MNKSFEHDKSWHLNHKIGIIVDRLKLMHHHQYIIVIIIILNTWLYCYFQPVDNFGFYYTAWNCRWEFKTEDHDIGFGVFYKSPKGSVPVVETSRVNSHVVAEDGSYICDKTGTCAFNLFLLFFVLNLARFFIHLWNYLNEVEWITN